MIRETDRCLVAALADGLGSMRKSAQAAQTATRTLCTLLSQMENPLKAFADIDGLRSYLVSELTRSIQEKAGTADVQQGDMDCTLAFAYISKPYQYAIIGRLGDSVVCVMRENSAKAFTGSMHTGNATTTILVQGANEHLYLSGFDLTRSDICGFILASDGLENELYGKGSTYVSQAAELYINAVSTTDNPQEIITNRLNELQQARNTPFTDDISIAVLSRVTHAIHLNPDPTWLCRCGTRNLLQSTYCRSCKCDFMDLYPMNFREYGGKSAFFLQLNQHPDKEKELVGLAQPKPKPAAQPRRAPGSRLARGPERAPGAAAPPSGTPSESGRMDDTLTLKPVTEADVRRYSRAIGTTESLLPDSPGPQPGAEEDGKGIRRLWNILRQ